MKQTDIDAVNGELAAWLDAGALVWSYHASHRQFTLRLHRVGERGNLHVVCTGCSWLQAPPQWTHAHLQLASIPTDKPFGECVLEDREAKCTVRCTRVTLERDVEPLY